MQHSMRHVIVKYRSEFLLISLIAVMLASPLIDESRPLAGVIAFLQLLLLVAGAHYLADRQVVRKVVIPLGILWVFARFLDAWGDPSRAYAHLSPAAGLALSLSVVWGLLRRFGSIEKVTRSVISEAIISYLFIAIAFSQLYWVLDHFVPNAFNQVVPYGQSSTFLYFSMITLSGVAYGGILPVNSYIRLVAAFENVTGMFYLAVVISRLVASYRPRPPRPLPDSRPSEPPE
jgi:hypothetical protein